MVTTHLKKSAQVDLPRRKSGTMSPSSQGTLRMCFITGFFFYSEAECYMALLTTDTVISSGV